MTLYNKRIAILTIYVNVSPSLIQTSTVQWLDLDPVLQSQYPHLHPPHSQYGSQYGATRGNVMPMQGGMGNMRPMSMSQRSLPTYTSGGNDMHPMYQRSFSTNDISGGSSMGNSYDGSPMHQAMGGHMGGGPSVYTSPHQGMQMLQYEMMNRGQSNLPNNTNPNSNPLFDPVNQTGMNTPAGMHMMNRGQWTPYSQPDYYGISQNSGGDGRSRGGGGMNMSNHHLMQSPQMTWQQQQQQQQQMNQPYGRWGPVIGGQGGDKDGRPRQENDHEYDKPSEQRRDGDESGKKRK